MKWMAQQMQSVGTVFFNRIDVYSFFYQQTTNWLRRTNWFCLSRSRHEFEWKRWQIKWRALDPSVTVTAFKSIPASINKWTTSKKSMLLLNRHQRCRALSPSPYFAFISMPFSIRSRTTLSKCTSILLRYNKSNALKPRPVFSLTSIPLLVLLCKRGSR